MANYATLKAAVENVVKTNGAQEITGANLQTVLLSIINSLGAGYQYMGVANPTTTPVTTDGRVFYIAGEAGTYGNFDSLVSDGIAILYYDTSWHISKIIGIDEEPTEGSKNLITSGVINEYFGKYTQNSEWVMAIQDKDGRFLFGIRNDGSVEWQKGVAQPIKEYFGTEIVSSYEFVFAIVDSEQKLLAGITNTGEVKVPSLDKKFSSKSETKSIDSVVLVAASDAPQDFKAMADYICDGVNDEAEIRRALRTGERGVKVVLSSGTFHIGSFIKYNWPADIDNYVAIGLPWYENLTGEYTITGNCSRGENATVISVDSSAWDGLDSNIQPSLFGSVAFHNNSVMNIRNVSIQLPDNAHKIVCINYQYLGGGDLERIVLKAAPNSPLESVPEEGCVALRSYMGWDIGTVHIWKEIVCIGFYEAYQLGAEHHVLINCSARYNYKGFTFGNYDYNYGTCDHPISLINCCDEHSSYLPQFIRCGWHDDVEGEGHIVTDKPLQAVNMYSFNLEQGGQYGTVVRASEAVAGSFCGRIEYTAGGVGRNSVTFKFWQDGYGHNFDTVNQTHAKGGTSSLRRSYVANYMQQYYDTDVRKLLTYDGENWVDDNGNIVS